jgi:hypothetical protein
VGTLLVALNQGDIWVSGHVTGRILMKSLLTPIIPFCVTMLGAFLNSRPTARAADLRPGWAAVRRSLIIALGVGSAITLLNQGEVLLAGAITPRVVVKMLVTPCVPFCVSFYGAYAAYRQALAEQRHAAGAAAQACRKPNGPSAHAGGDAELRCDSGKGGQSLEKKGA